MKIQYSQEMQMPRLVMDGWSALTRLYPSISKLVSSNKIPLSKCVLERQNVTLFNCNGSLEKGSFN